MASIAEWVAIIVFVAFTLWLTSLILGFRIVESGQVAWVFRLGKFDRVIKEGPHLTHALLERSEYHSTQVHQLELPDEEDRIDRVNDLLAPGMKHPYRVGHKGMKEAIFYMKKKVWDADGKEIEDPRPDSDPDSYEVKRFDELAEDLRDAMKKDSFHSPLTGEHAVVVNWQMLQDKKSVRNLIENVSTEYGRDREEEIRKRMEDEVGRVLQEYLVPVTFGHATERVALFSTFIRQRLEMLVGDPDAATGAADKPWGIELGDVFLKQPHAGKTVNTARNASAAAVSDAQALISKSEGEKQEKINKAEGDQIARQKEADSKAYEELVLAESKAAAIQKIGEVMNKPGAQYIAALEVAEKVLPHANFMLVPSDTGAIGNVLTLGANIAQATKKKPEPPSAP